MSGLINVLKIENEMNNGPDSLEKIVKNLEKENPILNKIIGDDFL